jgi:hypothetical protein
VIRRAQQASATARARPHAGPQAGVAAGGASAPVLWAPGPGRPGARRRPRRRLRRLTRGLLVLGLYLAAAGALYQLGPAMLDDVRAAEPAGVAGAQAVLGPGGEPVAPAPAEELAAAVRGSVFRLESPAGPLGSAFVAWFAGGRAFLLTAYAAVQPVVADAHGDLIVRRGARTWRATPLRNDNLTGLVVLRVEGRPGPPLWTEPEPVELRDGDGVAVVPPPARDLETAVGAVAVSEGVIRLETPWHPLSLGAPVIAADGSLAGVVVYTAPGAARISPIGVACGKIRRC